jgi:16S rRNA G966 N2-methylase RsmD
MTTNGKPLTTAAGRYQLLDPLSAEERAALKADIAKRGVLVAVEKDEDGNTLDGHNRVEIAEELGIDYPTVVRPFKTEQEKREHVIKLNLARRHLDPVRWGRAFKQLLQERGVQTGQGSRNDTATSATVAEVAAELGVPERTARYRVRQAEQYEALAPAWQERVRSGELKVSQAKTGERRESRRAELAAAAPVETADSVIRTGDFNDLVGEVEDNSVALIFTDPPYDEESLPLYGRLATHAARVLVPGGSLITYAGHYAIADVVNAMKSALTFWWILALAQGGPSARLPGKWVMVEWKPLLWFVKGGRRDNEYVADMLRTPCPSKDEHDWQQSDFAPRYCIDHLTQPGELVLDPMCGSGTTCLAALQRKRRTLGIEIDPDRAAVARSRILNLQGDGA